ncbi:MAG: ABC transporter permease [Gallionella sp.]|nr:ABC transporter permease [Gallionella sp.]
MTERCREKYLVAGPPFLFLLLMLAVPCVITLIASMSYPGEFGGLAPFISKDTHALHGLTLETYLFFFSDFIYTEIFIKSILMAAGTTLICLMMAYPVALLIARSPKKRRNMLVLLVILPFASNFLIRIYAWMIILGPQSALSRLVNGILHMFGQAPVHLLFSSAAVLTALVYVHLPFMVLPLYTNLEKHDPALLDAAQDLGANAWQRFCQVTFPLSLPGVFAGSALVFIPVLGVFAIPEILGGTGDMMIGNLIKEQFLVARDWPFGATLSVMLTTILLLIAWLTSKAGAIHA